MATTSRDPKAFAAMAGLCVMACLSAFGASFVLDHQAMVTRFYTVIVYCGIALLSFGFGIKALRHGRRGTFVMFSVIPAMLFLAGAALHVYAA